MFVDKLLWRTFGVPTGVLGRIGGTMMAGRRQRAIAAHVAELLDVRRGDRILEIGFGPGVGIQHLREKLGGEVFIAGIDPSEVMMRMARARNAEAVASGAVTLISGTAEKMPFESESFDKAYAMNSFHLWQEKLAGLNEVRRVLRDDGRLVLSFYGPAQREITLESVQEYLEQAGFSKITAKVDRAVAQFVIARK